MLSRVRQLLSTGSGALPYEMFEARYTEAQARRARKMENIYHVGQDRAWKGRDVLNELVKKHGRPDMSPEARRALARIFSIIMWGELAAWKISAQLADALVPLEAKLAAASQVHDEARHFYVMHDYLTLLGERPQKLDWWSRKVVEMTLTTDCLAKKLLGMQLMIETIALTIFQRVRELNAEPVLSELLLYYERDEARHVGLGVQLLPGLMNEMSLPEQIDIAGFQLKLLLATIGGLKSMEKDLLSIDVDPRSLLRIAAKKQDEINLAIRKDFPHWPDDPPVMRVFEGICEAVFPSEGAHANVPMPVRLAHALEVARRVRPGVFDTPAS
jgi:demethoxyubiquinone hydroxylase (CLK1/Coq7/Cat5 family)